MKQHAWVGVFILVLILGPIIHAATTATTLFVFNVPTNRGHTITYGGNCNANRFFFNETDANFDPDTDGNGTKVRPSPVRRTTVTTDYNYVPITAPSTTHMASGGFITSNPPGDNNSPTGEINNAGYGNIEA
ncbi:MAG: hypothetical protein FJY86_04655, partial [Candidatus Diapherotrites archaeon]|nr:hypothetical protein [Candidatus Diapherotrites archaeon]